MVLGPGCVWGSKLVLTEMVQIASITGHELKTDVSPIFQVSKCCFMLPPA